MLFLHRLHSTKLSSLNGIGSFQGTIYLGTFRWPESHLKLHISVTIAESFPCGTIIKTQLDVDDK